MFSIREFLYSENGAVTVDWVVLTAGIMSLGLAALSLMSSGTQSLTETLSQDVANRSASFTF